MCYDITAHGHMYSITISKSKWIIHSQHIILEEENIVSALILNILLYYNR